MGLIGEAKRTYQRDWLKKRRQAWIDSQGGCCAKCGSIDGLEVDHIDPSHKTMNPTRFWSRAASTVAVELENCQVLCSECHLQKTCDEMARADHGANSRYQSGCRCRECKAAHTMASREWRESRKMPQTLTA